MALHHKVLPPTIKVDRVNPQLEMEKSAFYVNTVARPWVMPQGQPRRAGVSSFGFCGSNFHLALEEYMGASKADRLNSRSAELMVLHGNTSDEVAKTALKYAEELSGAASLAWAAHTSQLAFEPSASCRLAI